MASADSFGLLGRGGLVIVGGYLAALLLVGWAGRRARKENTLADFYLSGRHMGLLVLFLTLYATQYSGLTLIGFAGNVYRQGFVFLVSVTFAIGIIGAYFVFAPRLYRLSRKHGFITVGDYLQHRYSSPALTLLTTLIFIATLGNYILSNLKAIGYVVEMGTGGQVSFVTAIVVMSLVMVLYETLGGMRSVAWSDVLQGIILLLGCVGVFALVQWRYGGLPAIADSLREARPSFWQPPDLRGKLLWISTIVLVFFGPPIYPHAIQRIYAARSETTLRRSLQLMLLMPLVTSITMIIVALVGAARFPGLDRQGSEQIVMVVLSDLGRETPAFRPMLILFLTAALAAIMSTVDSALLAISALFTQDLYAHWRPDTDQTHLLRVGKAFSWILMAAMAYLACTLPQTLWRLTEIKLEILCQAAPAIMLGLHLPWLRGRAVLAGVVAGLAVSLGMLIASGWLNNPLLTRPLGIHEGVWGLTANLLTIAVVTGAERLAGHQQATLQSDRTM